MSKQTQSSMLLVGVLAGGIGFMAFLMMLVVGEFDFNSSLFIAVLLALGVALFLFFAFHRPAEQQSTVVRSPQHAPPPSPAPQPAPAPAPAVEQVPAAAPEPMASDTGGDGVDEGTRPAALDGPRGGTADDLKKIKGVGPKMEKLCNSLGFYHFDQIANWTADEVAWVDNNLEGFKGRVSRDDWVAQAKLLASGGETEFSKKVEDGDVY